MTRTLFLFCSNPLNLIQFASWAAVCWYCDCTKASYGWVPVEEEYGQVNWKAGQTTPVFCLWEGTVKSQAARRSRESSTDAGPKLRSQPCRKLAVSLSAGISRAKAWDVHFYEIKQSTGEARTMLREDITVEVGTGLKLWPRLHWTFWIFLWLLFENE